MGRHIKIGLATTLLLSYGLVSAASDRISVQDEIANLRSANTGTRHRAARKLAKAGRAEAIPALNEAVGDPELKVRRAVVEALRGFESPEAIEGLVEATVDEDKKIRRTATTGLGEIYLGAGQLSMGKSPFDWLVGSSNTRPTVDPTTKVDARAVRALEGRLSDEEKQIRRIAAYSLGSLRVPSSVSALTGALQDPVEDVRLEVVDALGLVGGEEAGTALASAVSDASKSVRAHAVDALGEMRYVQASSQLVAIYDENLNKDLGDRALRALARMGAADARGVFYYQMTSTDKDRRRWAVEGIGRLGDTSLRSALIKDFLREPQTQVQLAYCFSLTLLGQAEFVDRVALSLADSGLKGQASKYAVELGSPALGDLAAYLSDPVPDVRREMTEVMVKIGDPEAIPYLRPLLTDSDADVADHANRAISRLEGTALSGTMAASTTEKR